MVFCGIENGLRETNKVVGTSDPLDEKPRPAPKFCSIFILKASLKTISQFKVSGTFNKSKYLANNILNIIVHHQGSVTVCKSHCVHYKVELKFTKTMSGCMKAPFPL